MDKIMDIIYTKDKYDKDILQDSTGNHQIMMEWEQNYMIECINKLAPFGHVLEVGFGLGYSATKILETEAVTEYSIIECCPKVWGKIEEFKEKYPSKKINLIKGRWEDILSSINHKYDSIFFDDYPIDNQPKTRFDTFLLQVVKNNTNINSKICVYSTTPLYNKLNCLNLELFDYKIEIPDNCKYTKGTKMYIPLFTKIKEYEDLGTIINTPKCMRFHCLSIPHTITNDDYNACAYTQKVLRFCKMMKKLGHYILYYGHPDSIVDCDEFINVISRDSFNEVYGSMNHKKNFFNTISRMRFIKNFIKIVLMKLQKENINMIFYYHFGALESNQYVMLIQI